MRSKWFVILGAVIGLLAGVVWAVARRPSQLLSAKVTSISSGSPPVANVALLYGAGLPPVNVILDIHNESGTMGSATIDGQQLFVDVPLSNAPPDGCAVSATVTYRRFGRLHNKTFVFPSNFALFASKA